MTDIKNNDSSDNDSLLNNKNRHSSMDLTPSVSRTDLDSLLKQHSLMQTDSSNNQMNNNFYSTSTPIAMKKSNDTVDQLSSESGHNLSNNSGVGNNSPLNEKVASLASSVYTELEKIVKLHGRDTVKDLMSILVNILEALDVAYQEKEEQIVENELLKDDYEKLLNQYEREKQSRKDTELKFFQSEDSFAEQKREYEEKVKSLESIVRMIDLKSKNTSDHVIRLEEKENELKREYNKLHERYSELFKTHCDYMERTKILFGNENRTDSNLSNNTNTGINRIRIGNQNHHQQHQQNINKNDSNKLIDLLRSPSVNINRNELINTLKSTNRSDLSMAINSLLSQELNQSNESAMSSSTIAASSTSSLTSLSSQQQQKQSQDTTTTTTTTNNNSDSTINEKSTINEVDDDDNSMETSRSKLNIQSSENFDEHISANCVEFDDTASVDNNKNDDEEEEEISTKNDLSLFNELSRENYDITELDDGADLTGMTREVANLIRENSELLQTKHALNVLKDDLIVRLDQFSSEMVILREEIKSLQTVKACLQLRISELEEEAKKTKEDIAQKSKKQEEDDENVPMSQRKRFTRAEMARVLMERNQYKEKLIDLQDAVRWTEMIRASKNNDTVTSTQPLPSSHSISGIASIQQSQSINNNSGHSSGIVADQSNSDVQQSNGEQHKKKTPLWKFFSDLFGSSSNSTVNSTSLQQHQHNSNSNTLTSTNTKMSTSVSNNAIVSPTTTKKSNKLSNSNEQQIEQELNDKQTSKAFEFLKEDTTQKLQTKSEQTRQTVVAKEDGRMQAYGWSLPSKSSLDTPKSSPTISVPVPVPVYCRPLFEQDNNLKLSCSSTVNFTFDSKVVQNCADLIEASSFGYFKSQLNNNEFKSSCIWICNLNDNDTHVSILDANRPGDLIEQFVLKYLKIYCIQCIGGANQSEYPLSEEKLNILSRNLKETNSSLFLAKKSEDSNFNQENINYIECEYDQQDQNTKQQIDKNENNEEVKSQQKQEKILSSQYPTMWMGSHEGWILVHSSISNISKTIDRVKLKDSVLCIVQNGGRVIAGLADGTVVIFHRNGEGLWDLKNFNVINFDRPHHSIRTLINVHETVWCGCRNKIFIINPDECKFVSVIEVHPRKENQVRHMAWCDDGVWVSLRLDSTLRLYHSRTHQQLQYLDIEPFITRMLGTNNLGLSLIRISSMVIGSKRLWIGTGNGVILSLPFTESPKETSSSKISSSNSANSLNIPGSVVRVNNETNGNKIPYCNLAESQFSFHGHRNAIKFFLSVPSEAFQKLNSKQNGDKLKPNEKDGYEKVETTLILSGGHGYIDFRIGDTTNNKLKQSEQKNSNELENNKTERAHLIVWQLNSN